MEAERIWYPYENGTSVGRRGPAGGRVMSDEELGDPEDFEDADARVTLEATTDAAFALTANVYGGWLQETAAFATDTAAAEAFAATKIEISRLAAMIPDEDDRDLAGQVELLNREVATFAARFGGSPTV